jgi:hypothetical protein
MNLKQLIVLSIDMTSGVATMVGLTGLNKVGSTEYGSECKMSPALTGLFCI